MRKKSVQRKRQIVQPEAFFRGGLSPGAVADQKHLVARPVAQNSQLVAGLSEGDCYCRCGKPFKGFLLQFFRCTILHSLEWQQLTVFAPVLTNP
jgi:hypothetical protein